MKIQSFKKDDIITRVAPASDEDTSYIGRRIRFISCKGSVIFVRLLNPAWCRNAIKQIAGVKWFDDNWDLFPEEEYQATRKENKERIERKIKKVGKEEKEEK